MALFSSRDPVPQKPMPRNDLQPMPGGTHFGPQITIEGTVTGSERVLIEGTVKGKINLTSDLHVGKQARVEASVHAKTVIVEGKVMGDISADEKVELVTTATVDGNIKAPKIVVAEGAKFRGSVDMGSAKPKEDTATQAKK